MSDPLARLRAAAAAAIRPPSRLLVWEWADAHRVLDQASAKPGPWNTDETPYLREPMEAMSPQHPCETIVLMFASQLGKTEAILNSLGHSIHLMPAPMMMVMPTTDIARDMSKGRLAPMLRATPVLRDRVPEPRSRDSETTMLLRRFPGGFLRLSGANSAASLASTPIRRLYLDEVDRYPFDVDGEGDPVLLAYKRTSTFVNKKKIILTSTPTIKGLSRIEQAYLASDQRSYYVPCPSCGHMQMLEWAHVQWVSGKPRTAVYVCPASGCVVENHQKREMLRAGEWRASVEREDDRVRGYHLSVLYAPPGLGPSFADTAEKFVLAKGDQSQLKVFLNTDLAETWEASDGTAVEPEGLQARCEPGDWSDELPRGVVLLTAGVDVQADRLECEIVGWAPGYESWSIDYRIIHGDPKGQDVWQTLDEVLTARYRHPSGVTVPIAAAGIDSGYSANDTYRFCRPRLKRRIWPVKGGGRGGQVWPVRAAMGGKWRTTPVYSIDESTAKMHIYDWLQVDEAGPGCCHFPVGRDDEWFRQLTAEKYVESFDRGKKTVKWISVRRRNEALDCRVYAYAALKGWEAGGIRSLERAQERLLQAAARVATEAPPPRRPKAPPAARGKTDALGRPQGSYWGR